MIWLLLGVASIAVTLTVTRLIDLCGEPEYAQGYVTAAGDQGFQAIVRRPDGGAGREMFDLAEVCERDRGLVVPGGQFWLLRSRSRRGSTLAFRRPP